MSTFYICVFLWCQYLIKNWPYRDLNSFTLILFIDYATVDFAHSITNVTKHAIIERNIILNAECLIGLGAHDTGKHVFTKFNFENKMYI